MGMQPPAHAQEALGMMGAQFPGSDEAKLAMDALQFGKAAAMVLKAHSDMTGAVDLVRESNAGQTADAFLGYMDGRSNVTGAEALARALGASALGHGGAAAGVLALKVAITACATGIQTLMNIARSQPFPPVAAAMMSAATTAAQVSGQALGQADQMAASLAETL